MSAFRPKTPGPEQLAAMQVMRSVFENAALRIESAVPPGRYRSLANTALEEAAMWVTKAITHEWPTPKTWQEEG